MELGHKMKTVTQEELVQINSVLALLKPTGFVITANVKPIEVDMGNGKVKHEPGEFFWDLKRK